jgi:glycosyltransferase involved in cell wall biosynthesis
VRLLFFKQSLAWPRASGHDVHGFHMMQACARLGAEVALATVDMPAPDALTGLPLTEHLSLDHQPDLDGAKPALSRLQERFRSFYGVSSERIHRLAAAARRLDADAVVAIGLDALPYLAGDLSRQVRVWYAADEWVWHHLSLVRVGDAEALAHLKSAALKGLYERAYAPVVDRAWVVSATEQRAMRWLAGVPHADVVPNGVDGDFFAPREAEPVPRSAVFWGRLDFEPNIQGLEWFCARVWPPIRERVPDARLAIVGFHASKTVKRLATLSGLSLSENVPDIRDEVAGHAVAVLPFVSGGGIKNKLLEAAAMGKAIVSTPRALGGLKGQPPLVTARSPAEWVEAITSLWGDVDRRRALGRAARAWVLEHQTWAAAAGDALAGIEASRAERFRS